MGTSEAGQEVGVRPELEHAKPDTKKMDCACPALMPKKPGRCRESPAEPSNATFGTAARLST